MTIPQQDAPADAATYQVKLDVFEGPFQLLLSLITEHRLDVCDIPIARLTEDYLAHLEAMEHADLEVTTEFLVVAATLLALKATALLPRPASEIDEEDDMERDLLIARLLEVQTFQSAGAQLAALLEIGDKRFVVKPSSDDPALRQLPQLADIAPADLAKTLLEIVRDQMRTVDTGRIIVDQVSTQEAAVELVRVLETGSLSFASIARGRSLAWSVALFLAVLELAMRGEVELSEGLTVGELELKLVAGGAGGF